MSPGGMPVPETYRHHVVSGYLRNTCFNAARAIRAHEHRSKQSQQTSHARRSEDHRAWEWRNHRNTALRAARRQTTPDQQEADKNKSHRVSLDSLNG